MQWSNGRAGVAWIGVVCRGNLNYYFDRRGELTSIPKYQATLAARDDIVIPEEHK